MLGVHCQDRRREAGVNSVFDAFRDTAKRLPDHSFLLVPASACTGYALGDQSYTYAQALAEVELLRDSYRNAGLGQGARVALLLENRPAYFFHWFALNALGVSVVPINPDYRRAEIEYLLVHSEAILAVVVAERHADLAAAAGAVPVVRADRFPHALTAFRVAESPTTSGLARECAVLYTSGTTGQPKGCLLSNDYFLRAGTRYITRGGYIRVVPGAARVLTPLPLFHMNAMGGSTMGMLMSGGCVIQLDRFHPRTWWNDVARTRATGIHYLGVMPAILLGLPTSPDERAHSVLYGSGANVEPVHHAAFEERFGFPLIEGWAMTETGSSGAISADREPRHVGTRCFGKPNPSVELRLVDEHGNDVADGEPGEIRVRRAGPDPALGFFSGYLKDPKSTAAGWSDGWWHTGDIARRGPDGSLYFLDRAKNLIRRSGENISALEVETVLLRHPAVAQVAVAPVEDELRGQEVMACVVLRERQAATSETAAAITDWALGELAYFKAPGRIAFVERLPVTATQKIQRGELRILAALLAQSPDCFDLRARKKRMRGEAV